jgi:hypothetical protein
MIFSPGLFGYLHFRRAYRHTQAAPANRTCPEPTKPEPEFKTMKMKSHFTGLTIAALLIAAAAVPARAEDAAPPKDQPAAAAPPPAAAQPEAPPSAVPRPSIVPKTAEPPEAPLADTPPPRHRRYAHRHRHWRYHYAYWQPFPIYWPHVYHNRLYWSRMPWHF